MRYVVDAYVPQNEKHYRVEPHEAHYLDGQDRVTPNGLINLRFEAGTGGWHAGGLVSPQTSRSPKPATAAPGSPFLSPFSRGRVSPFSRLSASGGRPAHALAVGGVRAIVVARAIVATLCRCRGLLCELDADSLRQAMVRLAGDSELRDRLGNAGREMLIVEKLTAADAADRVSAVYESAYV